MELWCPWAVKAPIAKFEDGAGPFAANCGSPRIVHHTTEGSSYVGAYSTYRVTGALPHFTDTFEGGIYSAFQHLPLDVAATALKHPAHSAETNRDHVIQIEHVGNAATSHLWLPGYLDGIGRLCRWIETQIVCPAECTVRFVGDGSQRLPWDRWHIYSGHLGHQHVPFNDHTDPGRLDITRILASPPLSPQPQPVLHPAPTEEAMIAIVPGAPLDSKNRVQHWECDHDGNINAWNGAPDLKSLNQIEPNHKPIKAIEALDDGTGVILVAEDGHHEGPAGPAGEWAQSTYTIKVGM